MAEFSSFPACGQTCPAADGRLLHQMAAQLIQPEQWLYGPPESRAQFGRFSLNAVRVAKDNFIIEDVAGPRYGSPKAFTSSTPEFHDLAVMQRRMRGGEALDPGDVRSLGQFVTARSRSREAFLKRPIQDQQHLARLALPFLQGVELSLMEKDPELQALDPIIDDIASKISPEDRKIKQIADAMRSFDQLYALDQGAFMVADEAVRTCRGPWSFIKSRWLAGPAIVEICPHGSARNKDYDRAKPESGAEGPAQSF